jgi:mono/diheme cytochrome c family protein
MLKRFSFFLSLTAWCGVVALAQMPVVTISMPGTQPNNGKQMYTSYCATCHGLDGRGHGATAALLQARPADLSVLSRNNHGVYPARHVESVLDFGVETTGHGSKTMPAWGPMLEKLDHISNANDEMEALRISNLTRYVETLQIK